MHLYSPASLSGFLHAHGRKARLQMTLMLAGFYASEGLFAFA